jgi:hypothetical protein
MTSSNDLLLGFDAREMWLGSKEDLPESDQHCGLDFFTNVGSFVPLTVDQHGTVLCEVAPAQFLLARPDRNDEPLSLSVTLIRDVRRTVVNPPSTTLKEQAKQRQNSTK